MLIWNKYNFVLTEIGGGSVVGGRGEGGRHLLVSLAPMREKKR